MNGFLPRNPSARERHKKNRAEKRRARQFAAAMTVGAALAPAASFVPDSPGSFPAAVQIERPQEVPIRYVAKATEDTWSPSVTPRDLSVSVRAEQHRARVATLERMLLDDLEQSHLSPPLLKEMTYQVNAEEALMRYVLGEAYMRSLSDRLAKVSVELSDAESDLTEVLPFHLYMPSADGIGIEPTPEAIEAWETMRKRMLRGKSELGRRWSSSGSSWSPWYVASRRA